MKGGNDGLGEQGWSRRGRMVQWSRDGVGEQGWSWGARMVLWSRDGVGEQGWSCGARMVQGSKNDAVVKALGCHRCGPDSTPGINAVMICWLSSLLQEVFLQILRLSRSSNTKFSVHSNWTIIISKSPLPSRNANK